MARLKSRLIIEGVNTKGEIFRPSDWAQRLSSVGADYGADHRLHFSPLLHPYLSNGIVCLVVEPELEDSRPEVFKHVMSFAESNDLVTHYDDVA
ncbi:MAG: DUF3579 domain-containing protein [Gammaproteobacteria bacterium]|nr:DUF3579 domain-containing protein [Gammaproteobacteria bacterium]